MQIQTKFDVGEYAWFKDLDDHKWYLVEINAINIHRFERPITTELTTNIYYDVCYKEVTGKPATAAIRPIGRMSYDTIPEEELYKRKEDIYVKTGI